MRQPRPMSRVGRAKYGPRTTLHLFSPGLCSCGRKMGRNVDTNQYHHDARFDYF